MTEGTARLACLEDLVETAAEIGSVVSINYERAVVASNDYHVDRAGGVPKRCFLIAVPEGDFEESVVLLSVTGTQDLESMRGVQHLKEELAKTDRKVDPDTTAVLQLIGYSCDIVGSFYMSDGKVKFGADVDQILSSTAYKVYRPRGKSLGRIASYSRNSTDEDATLDVGVVRYTETQRSPDSEARVSIDVRDFIGKKTALLGMSRSGKSNTIKVICQQVFKYSLSRKKRIGQVIFDPQGEYANVNVQDGGALSSMGTGHDVAIYRTNAVSESGTNEKPLLFNFFDEKNAELVWDLMLSELHTGASAGSNYISGLRGLSLAKPPATAPIDEKNRYGRRRLGLYSLMFLARMNGSLNFYLTLDTDLASKLHQIHPQVSKSTSNDSQLHITSLEGANSVFDQLLEWYEIGTLSNDSWVKSFKDGEMATFREQVEAFRSGRKGVTSAFMRLKELHSDKSSGDVRYEVWKDLENGKLVIIDLSRGSAPVTKAISEMIVTSLIGRASDRFVTGKSMVPFQIVVEEAHNLFSRRNNDDDYMDPWVRLSKEASKYEIGLVYATQEVSSVDTKILSNTSNWVISHLNSKKETSELSGYYNFSDWSDHLRKTETKGFVRLKTESSPFIIPVQMDLFDPSKG